MGGAGNHTAETEGDWAARRDASMRAYFEWMPVRDPEPGRARHAYWRTYRFGDLASLVTLETRHSGRDQQPPYPDFDSFKTAEDRERYVAEVLGDPNRRIPEDAFPPAAQYMIPNGRWNLPWYSDTWDGYTAARERFYAMAREVGATDLLVLTGDTHNFFASELFTADGERAGVEIGATGISSPGEFRDAGFPLELVERIDAIFAEGMPEVRWTESVHNGYVRLVLTPEAADVTFVGVDTVLVPEYRTLELKKERIVKSDGTLVYA
jgi:alkaline phosphatase D